MSKPLELTVYEIDQTEPSMVVVDGFWAYRPYDPAKRLTDAELAAEHWCCCALWFAAVRDDDDYEGAPDTRELQRRAEILERFATLPNYDEVA